MVAERIIDFLIEEGWKVLESDFDLSDFVNWRSESFQLIEAMMGPDHPYTHYFRNFVSEPEIGRLLAGEGILNAVKEQLGRSSPERRRTVEQTSKLLNGGHFFGSPNVAA